MKYETNKQGVFSMDRLDQILAIEDIKHAISVAREIIAEASKLPYIRQASVQKAHAMLDRCKNQKDIVFGMSNFILAFQGLKVIK